MKLPLGNEYNLNNINELKITDDFLSLDKNVIECQNKESLTDCSTRKYMNEILRDCNCLPFAIRNDENVSFKLYD